MAKKGGKEKRFLRNIKMPLYLNANLVYGEALNRIKKPNWKRNIKAGTLAKLQNEGYSLVTSILTRMEVIQRLCREENKKVEYARRTYHRILEDYKIVEITSIDKHVNLSDALIDRIATSRIDFKDSIHLRVAERLKIPVCTHDKKLRDGFSQHDKKMRWYGRVFKPHELIKPKK